MRKQTLSNRQARTIRELLADVAPDFARSISLMLQQQMETKGLKNPIAFTRSCVVAVRNGRHGENKGLIIPRAKLAVTCNDRQGSGKGQVEG